MAKNRRRRRKRYRLLRRRGLVVADLAVLRHWLPEVGWQHVPSEAGAYAATVRGFRVLSDGRELTRAGYELVLDPREALPPATADTGRPMRVINWWDESGSSS